RRFVSGRSPAGLFGPLSSTKIHVDSKTAPIPKSRPQIIHRSAFAWGLHRGKTPVTADSWGQTPDMGRLMGRVRLAMRFVPESDWGCGVRPVQSEVTGRVNCARG